MYLLHHDDVQYEMTEKAKDDLLRLGVIAPRDDGDYRTCYDIELPVHSKNEVNIIIDAILKLGELE